MPRATRSCARSPGCCAPPPPAGGSAYRLGGDEFALVFEAAGRPRPSGSAWQLQAQARERLGATLSIGVAVADPAETHEALVDRADAALYAVKRQGRDGVVTAT